MIKVLSILQNLEDSTFTRKRISAKMRSYIACELGIDKTEVKKWAYSFCLSEFSLKEKYKSKNKKINK